MPENSEQVNFNRLVMLLVQYFLMAEYPKDAAWVKVEPFIEKYPHSQTYDTVDKRRTHWNAMWGYLQGNDEYSFNCGFMLGLHLRGKTFDCKKCKGGSESPRPLCRQLPPSEAYPVDALGTILGDAARAINQAIQALLALCSQSILAAATLAVQPYGNIHIDGRKHPVSEFFLTVAGSGERKSATDDAANAKHREYERELQTSYSIKYSEYEKASSAYKKAKEEALKKAKGYAAKKEALDALGEAPPEPMLPVLLMQEPTFEGLCKAMLYCRPSVGIFNDEAGTYIGGHALNEENRLKTAAGLSAFWDGKTVSRVRGGDGVTALSNRRLAVHMMAQPQVARMFLGDSLLIDQGLLSRFLLSWPESTAGSRPYRETDLSKDPAMLVYYERMDSILREKLPVSLADEKELCPPAISLTADAKKFWIEFHDLVESQLADEQPLAPIKGIRKQGSTARAQACRYSHLG